VCLIVSCLVVFKFQSKAAPPAQAQSAQIETQRADASPVAVPEPSPKAVSFYRSTMLLIAVVILWNLVILVGFLFTGFFGQAAVMGRKGWPEMVFLLRDLCTAFSLIYFLLLLPLIYYGRFILLHHYDLSNQSFARWLYCSVQGAAIVLISGLAAGWIPFFVIKKSPRHWWLYLGC